MTDFRLTNMRERLFGEKRSYETWIRLVWPAWMRELIRRLDELRAIEGNEAFRIYLKQTQMQESAGPENQERLQKCNYIETHKTGNRNRDQFANLSRASPTCQCRYIVRRTGIGSTNLQNGGLQPRSEAGQAKFLPSSALRSIILMSPM